MALQQKVIASLVL